MEFTSSNDSKSFLLNATATLNVTWSSNMAAVDACTSPTYIYPDLTQLTSVRAAIIAVYVVVITVALLGNGLMLCTMARCQHMSVTNIYIVNLSLCDFLIALFAMPLKLLEYAAPCSLGVFATSALCSFLYFILPVFVFASVLTLTAISFERFYAIVYPLKSLRIHTRARTIRILVAIWVTSVVLASPYLFCRSYPFSISSHYGTVSRQICNDRFDEIDSYLWGQSQHGQGQGRFRLGFFVFLFIFIYVCPSALIVATCVSIVYTLLTSNDVTRACNVSRVVGGAGGRKVEENKRRVARMIVVMALAFVVAWTPFYVTTLASQVQENSFLRQSNFLFTMLAIHLAGFINSCTNPLIYHAMSRQGTALHALLSCCCRSVTSPSSLESEKSSVSETVRLRQLHHHKPHQLQQQQRNSVRQTGIMKQALKRHGNDCDAGRTSFDDTTITTCVSRYNSSE